MLRATRLGSITTSRSEAKWPSLDNFRFILCISGQVEEWGE